MLNKNFKTCDKHFLAKKILSALFCYFVGINSKNDLKNVTNSPIAA